MKATIKVQNFEMTFSDEDVLNPEDFIASTDYNPRKSYPWVLHDHGTVIAVVFADSLAEALDIAADSDKLDRYLIHLEIESDRQDYMTSDFSKADAGQDENCPEYISPEGVKYWWKHIPAFLGNASEPFDIESIGYIELKNVPFSFAAIFAAAAADESTNLIASHQFS